MFSIIVSEKGGAERREQYDKTEISVGRVQGNDLMLPKGNVSKRHARLLYRDGRFIVTDLKSTNGTYVNGRKIAQATIVREGDKIYIGDFVLKIDSNQAQQPGPMESDPSLSDAPPERQTGSEASRSSHPSSPEANLGRGVSPRIESKPAPADHGPGRSQEIISHFPLEQDPDESAPAYHVPGPPRMPSSPRPISFRSSSAPSLQALGARPPTPRIPSSTPTPMPHNVTAAAGGSVAPSSAGGRRAIPPGEVAREATAATANAGSAQHVALVRLIERVGAALDLSSLDAETPADDPFVERVERALDEQLTQMKSAGDLPSSIDPDILTLQARRELLELGPIGPLLADEDVSEVQVIRHDFVLAMHGRRQVATGVGFSSEQAVGRVLSRLCALSGRSLEPGETYVQRRLPGGERVFAVLPPAANHGHMLVVRKSTRADLSLDDLVRSGTISRAMATLLAAYVGARANVLITGSLGAGTTSLVGALASSGSTDDRVVVLQEDDELILNQPHTVSILVENGDDGAQALLAAARVHPDRLIVGAFGGRMAVEVVDAIGDGVHGVLAAARAPTLRQAVLRLPADLAATRHGLSPEVAREWLASSFDLAIEVARLRDGRHRVMRIAEMVIEGNAIALRDVFSFVVERTAAGGALEGTFYASGVVPQLIEDLVAQGAGFDTSIFKRHPGR